MFVRNVGSWAGLNFSHNDGEIIELPDGIAEKRVTAGRAENLTEEEIAKAQAAGLIVTRPSPDVHPDHVPGAQHGGVQSVANPNHRPGMGFAEGHAIDVEADTKARKRRGKAAAAGEAGQAGSLGTLIPSTPAVATLEGGPVTATTGAGEITGTQTDSGSGHTAESGDAASADGLAQAADAGPPIVPPVQPAADTSQGG